ncbi:AsmA-like C-terminal region-containing protein [Roseomonas gilardii]|uniref:AsmA-like C-terminal region-containing protein n=1 Tax=Roseomonas gilardii TaxID=257708 RepID=A0ABU3MJH5_9PROT|nr:AsmA-like C-terminal region-containing protein [Roseomonas gilardii]MDT8332485.1 AsmA-like C-terminal region-containing protein [Roseomonas gilardii]
MTAPRRLGAAAAVLLALVLAGLWFAPRLLDWTAWRGQLASLAAQRLGMAVTLSGPVHLTLLPEPMLEAEGVTVGLPEASLGFGARALNLKLDGWSLLAGRMAPRELTLVGADIRLPWPPVPSFAFSASLASFQAEVVDSRLTIGSMVFERVRAKLSAGSYAEAMRATGSFVPMEAWAGREVRFDATLGRAGFDGTMPLDLTLSSGGTTLATRGALPPEGGLEGRIEASGPDLSLMLPGPPGPFRAQGRLSASADLIIADGLDLDFNGNPARGAMTLRLRPQPRLDLSLAAGRLNLDPWQNSLRAGGGLPFGLDFSVEAATLRGVPLRRLRASVFREGDRLSLTDASAVLPGETQVTMNGATAGRRLEALLDFRSEELRATLAALGWPLPSLAPDRLQHADGRARLVIEDGQVAVPELSATVDGTRLSGAGVFRQGLASPPGPGATAGQDGAAQPGSGPGGGGQTAGGTAGGSQGSPQGASQGGTGGRSGVGQGVGQGAGAGPGGGTQTQANAPQATAPQPGGAPAGGIPGGGVQAGAGQATPVTATPGTGLGTGAAVTPAGGVVQAVGTQRPSFGLGVTLDRLDLDGLLAPGRSWEALSAELGGFDANLRLAADRVRLRGVTAERAGLDAALEAGRLTLRQFTGRVAGADVTASGVAMLGAQPRLSDLMLEVAAPDPRPLFAALPGNWPDGTRLAGAPLTLRLSGGGPLDALGLRLEGDWSDLRLDSSGVLDLPERKLAGNVILRHPGVPRLVRDLTGWEGAEGWLGQGSMSLIANVTAGPRGVSSDRFDLVAGTLRTGGQLSLAFAGSEAGAARPRLTGRLMAEDLPLPAPVLDARPLPLDPLRLLDLDVAVAAGRIGPWGGPLLEHSESTVRLLDGLLEVDVVRGRLRGGDASGRLALRAAEDVPRLELQGRIAGGALEGALTGWPLDLRDGEGDAVLRLSAQGRSPSAMLATLGGEGSLEWRQGVLLGIDGAAALAAARMPGTQAEARLRQALSGGETPFDRLTMALQLQDGRARITSGEITATDLLLGLGGEIDLTRRMLDLGLSLRIPDGPEVRLRLAGPDAAPKRVPELTPWLLWRAEQGL